MSGLAIAMSTWPLSFTGRVTLKSSSKACFLLWINSVQTLLTAFMRSWRPRKWRKTNKQTKNQQKNNLSKTQYEGSNFLHVLHLRISSIVLNCQKKMLQIVLSSIKKIIQITNVAENLENLKKKIFLCMQKTAFFIYKTGNYIHISLSSFFYVRTTPI